MPAPTYPPSIYEAVIKRLRDTCPIFSSRVGGASELSTTYRTVATADIPVPQAWVIPLFENDESQELSLVEEDHNSRQHKVAEYFSVIVVVDNGEGGGVGGKGNFSLRGHAAIEAARAQVRSALMGWRIKPRFTPCRLTRGDHLAMNHKYLWHVWEFRFSEIIYPALPSDQLDEAEAALIASNSMSDWPDYANSLMPRLTQVHVGFSVGQGNEKATTRDYYDDEPTPASPSQLEIDAAINGEDWMMPVDVGNNIPANERTPEEIGAMIYRPTHFDDYYLHGTEAVEPTGDS